VAKNAALWLLKRRRRIDGSWVMYYCRPEFII
jgi:hypothetical protein